MEPQKLSAYITEQIRAGKSKQGIQEQLVAVGWSEDEANTAYAKTLLEMGVPAPVAGSRGAYGKKSSTVEVVLNLFSFILLGIITTALGTLYFSVIEYFFPDPLTQYYSYSGTTNAIHYAMAALIIGFPLFVLAVRMWFTKFREEENKVESSLTKWVTYLVLLIAAVVIVGDLITVLYTFLQGEISIRFFLKGLTVLAIAGSIFGFYFLERKKIQYHNDIPRKTFQLFGWSLLGVIVVGIILGFVATGSPQSERMRTLDSRRSSDLNELALCINDFAQQFEALPSSLEELEKTSMLSYCANKVDPETNEPYEYQLITPLTSPVAMNNNLLTGTFELCATFALDSRDGQTTPLYLDRTASKWYTHTTGRNCFEETVNVKPTGATTPLLIKPVN
jgi:membrane protein YqaA with SNARE-associated domain